MSAVIVAGPPTSIGGRIEAAITDGSIVAWRNLVAIWRVPIALIFELVQPIMFVLLFRFIYENAFRGIPIDYVQFLMPGIFVQNAIFGSTSTAIGLAEDLKKGLLDRFRSLPMARSAVLSGRTTSDVVYNAGILVVLMISGVAVGWTIHTGIVELLLGVGLLLLFAFAMAWLGVFLGLMVPSVEVGQQVIFTVLFPITFISNVFVPPDNLPDFLRPIAEWNPTSTLTAALRELWGNPNPFVRGDSLAVTNPALVTIIWAVVIIAIFGPLGVRRYRSMSR